MKKVLIIGKHSYIGTSFASYAKTYAPELEVTSVSARDGAWRNTDLSRYDAILHVAGKAHADVGNVTEDVKKEYYDVNYKMAVEAADMAKNAGIKLFIYPSSMIIYGESAPIGKHKVITKDTIPTPANFYGDSKLQADLAIQKMSDETFQTAVLRLPMVYGKNSKGNYPILAKMAKKLPVFPKIKNERSMIYIGNLCEFLREIIENGSGGVFYPQNAEYTVTSEMVKKIAEAADKQIHLTAVLTPFVYLAGKIPGKIGQLANKAFGSCIYDKELSRYENNRYQIYSLQESVQRTEGA